MQKFENIQVSTADNYTVPEMARLFHSFPRLSVRTFQPVPNNFDLNLEDGKLELNPYFMVNFEFLTGSFPFVPPPPPLLSGFLLFALADARTIFLHNDLTCNDTRSVSGGCITFWGGGGGTNNGKYPF